MKRFYRKAETMAAEDGSYRVALDGRPIKTPAKQALTVPNAGLATAIAAEWAAQDGDIRPAQMPLTRLASTAIDRVAPQRDLVVQQIAAYAGTDLVCYRAAHPPELTARQQAVWQPLLDWAVLRYDAPLEVTAGVIPISQPPASLRAFAAAVAEHDDFALAALHLATGACGSLVIVLALIEGRIDPAEAFAASQLDESFEIENWGEDEEQAQRRRALCDDIAAAARFLSLLRD
ncbi:MAG TPA: ATP12 family protein [Stellaceae bacterium]|jgi:chaperone required for assembly of F1-ATPase